MIELTQEQWAPIRDAVMEYGNHFADAALHQSSSKADIAHASALSALQKVRRAIEATHPAPPASASTASRYEQRPAFFNPREQSEFWCNCCDAKKVNSEDHATGRFYIQWGHRIEKAIIQDAYDPVVFALCIDCMPGTPTPTPAPDQPTFITPQESDRLRGAHGIASPSGASGEGEAQR